MTRKNDQSAQFVKWLSEIRQTDLLLVGGKAANLGELHALGLPVPDGFCVTTEAFQNFAKRIDLKAQVSCAMRSLDIEDSKQLRKASRAIGDFIHSHRIPDEVERATLEAYHALSESNGQRAWVAVRSSATTEDLPGASFAGQLETYLNIREDQNVLEAVRKCWAALFTERVIAYREKNGFSHSDASMGVVVQEMVDATKSGIMFTVHPVTKDQSKILIEATIGLGEAVVAGAVKPDTYFVDKETLEVTEQHIGSKQRVVLRNPVGGGVIRIETPDQERRLCLSSGEVAEVAELGRRIEAHYSEPQDIEWAINNNSVYILQTRPVTGL